MISNLAHSSDPNVAEDEKSIKILTSSGTVAGTCVVPGILFITENASFNSSVGAFSVYNRKCKF